jgi:hypothetical protein
MKYKIRFNKSRGMPGRGSSDHVWRVFEGEKEYLFKNFRLDVPAYGEKEEDSEDWNIIAHGILVIDKTTSTATISKSETIISNSTCTPL